MTTEERLGNVEHSTQHHDATIALLTTIAERQQDLLEQVQRDSANTQRLWVRLAKRFGWLEDED